MFILKVENAFLLQDANTSCGLMTMGHIITLGPQEAHNLKTWELKWRYRKNGVCTHNPFTLETRFVEDSKKFLIWCVIPNTIEQCCSKENHLMRNGPIFKLSGKEESMSLKLKGRNLSKRIFFLFYKFIFNWRKMTMFCSFLLLYSNMNQS